MARNKKSQQTQGNCPKCGQVGNLNYETILHDGYGPEIYFPFDCPNCEFEGRECYIMAFSCFEDEEGNKIK